MTTKHHLPSNAMHSFMHEPLHWKICHHVYMLSIFTEVVLDPPQLRGIWENNVTNCTEVSTRRHVTRKRGSSLYHLLRCIHWQMRMGSSVHYSGDFLWGADLKWGTGSMSISPAKSSCIQRSPSHVKSLDIILALTANDLELFNIHQAFQ